MGLVSHWGLYLLVFFCFAAQAEPRRAVLPLQYWLTQTGTPVYFVDRPEIPMVDVAVVFNAGSARDGKNPGIAQLTAQMLNQGTWHLNADQIAERFEQVGGRYSAEVLRDTAVIHVRSLTTAQFLTPALTNFIHIISAADFPKPALENLKQRVIIAWQQGQQTPRVIASRAFYKALYQQHPYASDPLGQPASLQQLTSDALRRFYQRYYVARNAVLIIIGNLNRTKASRLADQLTAALPSGEPAPDLTRPVTTIAPNTKVQWITYPAQQTTILLGQLGIAAKDPAYFPLKVGNHILGGAGFTSRLFNAVRIKRGLCYGINSQFQVGQVAAPFAISLQTRREQTYPALVITQKILSDFINKGPNEKELRLAKQALNTRFPLAFATNSAILAQLINLGLHRLPLDYFDTYRQKIGAVTRAQIQAAFKQYIQANKMKIIMVGNPIHNPKDLETS